MTNDLENILDRICRLRTLEKAFQSTKISKFSGGACPQTPLVAGPHVAGPLIKNKIYIYLKSWTVSVLNSSKRKNN